jgi:hypothetical protein
MRLSRALSLALLIASLAPGLAWKGETRGSVRPIAEVLANAESGDVISVEGKVLDTTTGSGSLLIAILQDETGQVHVAVPESLTRKLDMQLGEAAHGQRYRVSGRWDHKHLDADTWGIYAQQIERLPTP